MPRCWLARRPTARTGSSMPWTVRSTMTPSPRGPRPRTSPASHSPVPPNRRDQGILADSMVRSPGVRDLWIRLSVTSRVTMSSGSCRLHRLTGVGCGRRWFRPLLSSPKAPILARPGSARWDGRWDGRGLSGHVCAGHRTAPMRPSFSQELFARQARARPSVGVCGPGEEPYLRA